MYRQLKQSITTKLNQQENDIIIVYGARQVGKTTLVKDIAPDAIYINLDKAYYADALNSRNTNTIRSVFEREKKTGTRIVVLDEFQRLQDPGLIAKVIHDELLEYQLIITGSSALELAFKASESMTGRKTTYTLYPLTLKEKLIQLGKYTDFETDESQKFLDDILASMRYGLYPELLNREQKQEYLQEYTDSVILKDVFYLDLVRNTKHLQSLLKLLAYQIGNLINISDLANRIGISRQTVEKYVDILKKIFIIYTLPPFRKNRRDEIGKAEKVYFYDLGVRNALINDFSPVEYRRDYGALFENFAVNELQKMDAYSNTRFSFYYWRTKGGAEVDLILDKDGKQTAIEIKTRGGSVSQAFKNSYPNSDTKVLTLQNIGAMLLS